MGNVSLKVLEFLVKKRYEPCPPHPLAGSPAHISLCRFLPLKAWNREAARIAKIWVRATSEARLEGRR